MLVKCSKCGREFEKGVVGSTGHRCPSCHRQENKVYRDNNKNRIKEYSKEHYNGHKEERKAYRDKYKDKTKEYNKKYHDEHRDDVKIIILSHYSIGNTPYCCICGETDIRCLELDHVDNDGAAHRKLVGGSGCMYIYLIRHNFPNNPRLQVLCANCNRKKESKLRKEKITTDIQLYQHNHRLSFKKQVLHHYANNIICCQHCGKNDIDILCMDHINGGGTRHAQEISGGSAYLYKWIKENQYPSGFQILCCNCNRIKAHTNQEYSRNKNV